MAKEDEGQGFRTLAEAEEAYRKLQTKLGKQGEELGTLREQAQAATQTAQQYAQWAQQAQPIVEWYGKNEAEVKRRWSAFEQGGAGAGAGNGNGGAGAAAAAGAVQQAAAVAQQDPRFQWLTPEEKQSIVGDIAQNLLNQHLAPWTQTFSKQAQEYAQKAQEALGAQLKSHTDVLWRSLSFVLPKDKMEQLQQWHNQALQFADPSKLDPMKHAQDWMNLNQSASEWKTKYEELEKKITDRDKAAAAPSILGGAPPDAAATPSARPVDKQDRFNRVMETVKTEHGPEGAHALFGSGSQLS